MKNILLTISLISICLCGFAQSGVNGVDAIDYNDSVFFDLAGAIIHNDTIDIPVSIKSDDEVYTLDFWMKYNHNHLEYVTVINNTSYMTTEQYYNTSDSTIRFTSDSFTEYEDHPIQLAFVRFKKLTQNVLETDLYGIGSLLNGDSCTSNLLFDSTMTTVGEVTQASVALYPNPATKYLNVNSTSPTFVQLFDINGREVLSKLTEPLEQINISDLLSGTYIVNTKTGGLTKAFRIIVCN